MNQAAVAAQVVGGVYDRLGTKCAPLVEVLLDAGSFIERVDGHFGATGDDPGPGQAAELDRLARVSRPSGDRFGGAAGSFGGGFSRINTC